MKLSDSCTIPPPGAPPDRRCVVRCRGATAGSPQGHWSAIPDCGKHETGTAAGNTSSIFEFEFDKVIVVGESLGIKNIPQVSGFRSDDRPVFIIDKICAQSLSDLMECLLRDRIRSRKDNRLNGRTRGVSPGDYVIARPPIQYFIDDGLVVNRLVDVEYDLTLWIQFNVGHFVFSENKTFVHRPFPSYRYRYYLEIFSTPFQSLCRTVFRL